MTREDIVTLAQQHPDMTVYSPPAPERSEVKASTLRARRSKRRREPPAVMAWRARMASEEGHEVYRRRKLTERAHGIIKNRGMTRFPRAWSGKSTGGLPAAGTGTQPVLG